MQHFRTIFFHNANHLLLRVMKSVKTLSDNTFAIKGNPVLQVEIPFSIVATILLKIFSAKIQIFN